MGDLPNDNQILVATQRADDLAGRAWVLLGAAVIFGATAPLATETLHRNAALVVAGVLVLVTVWLRILSAWRRRQMRKRIDDIMVFVENDSAPALCTDRQGAVTVQNPAAVARFGAAAGDVLSRVLEPLFANPDAVVTRLRSQLVTEKAAREDVVTRRGHVRISVTEIPGGELWRMEDMVDRPARSGDGIALPMLTTSTSGTILFINEALRQITGRRAKRLSDIFDDLPLRNGGIHKIRTADSTKSVRVAVSRPVSDRKEIFLLPVEERDEVTVPGGLDGLLDTLPIALVRIDEKGCVHSLNRAGLKLLPRGSDGGMPLAALVEGLGRSVGEWVGEAIEGRGLYRPEVVRVTGAGEVYLQITLGRAIEQGGNGLVAVLNDATELKSIEAQFVQSQKMQAIGQLAGGVAHDFNNLLTAITGHCDLLLLRREEDDPDFADLSQINQNANRAAALVGQLLAFSRKQTLKMQELDLRDTLSDMTHLLNRLLGERVRLVVAHDPALIPIRGDRRQLEQVLMNLVVNARDAMPEGGDVRIETVCRYLDSGLTRDQVTIPPGQYVIVRVSDQGRGIEPEKIGRIFEPFFTTKRPGEGTGLGLSMAYGIVKQSGGYIFADSQPGDGAVFSLYFPAGRDVVEAGASTTVAIKPDEDNGYQLTPAWIDSGKTGDDLPTEETRVQPASDRLNHKDPAATDLVEDSAADPSVQDDQRAIEQPLQASQQENQTQAKATPHRRTRAGLSEDLKKLAETANSKTPTAPNSKSVGTVKIEPPKFDLDLPDNPDPIEDVSPPVVEKAPEPAKPNLGPGNCTVLLVEDEAPVRAFASRALRLKGYTVVEASCAEDALATLDDADLDVDLFVTDVMMPGLDGPTWVRQALQSRPEVRTIFVSGYTQDTMSETSVPVPNSYFLPKPFSLADLTRTVQRALQ